MNQERIQGKDVRDREAAPQKEYLGKEQAQQNVNLGKEQAQQNVNLGNKDDAANRQFKDNLRRDDNIDQQQLGREQRFDIKDDVRGADKFGKNEMGINKDQDRIALEKQQKLNQNKQQSGMGLDKDRIEREQKEQLGKDAKWSEDRERFGQNQDRDIGQGQALNKDSNTYQRQEAQQGAPKLGPKTAPKEQKDQELEKNKDANFQAQNLGLRRD